VKNWLKTLFSETPSQVWLILSAASTLATFFLKSWSDKPFFVAAASMILGFAWANFRLFQKQQGEIERLGAALRFLRQRDEEDRIRNLQELRAVIADALDLARTWMHHVPGIVPNPQAIPDPSQITENRLLDVRSHARSSPRIARGLSSTGTLRCETPGLSLRNFAKLPTVPSALQARRAIHYHF
jgi:hypothetical protein